MGSALVGQVSTACVLVVLAGRVDVGCFGKLNWDFFDKRGLSRGVRLE